jgi:hypothetical protein
MTNSRGMASVNQTRPHCVNQMGKTHSKPLEARLGHSTLCVNRPLQCAGSLYKTRAESHRQLVVWPAYRRRILK